MFCAVDFSRRWREYEVVGLTEGRGVVGRECSVAGLVYKVQDRVVDPPREVDLADLGGCATNVAL